MTPSTPQSPRRNIFGALVASLLVVACAGASDRLDSAHPDGAAGAPTTSSAAVTSVELPTTAAPTTAPTTAPHTTTTSTTTSTVAPTTTVEPTTTAATTSTSAPAPDGAAALTDYPDQPAGVPFPTDQWAEGDLPRDVSHLALDAATNAAFGPDDAESRVNSIVVVRGGEIVYERYHPLDGQDKRFSSFSVAKSITSALVGLAVADGELDVDDTSLRAEWQAAGDPRQAITLRDLLQMSSGLEWGEDYTAPSDVIDMIVSADAAAFVAAKPLEFEPGTVFEYSTGTTALLVGIVADRLGGCGAATAYLNERLFDPIGISTEELLLDDAGCWLGGLGANMTTRDFARFGLLYLRGGEWDGEQLLPTSWIDASRTPADTNAAYGFQWWLSGNGDVFQARGLFGQLIVVVPSLDVVIAVNSSAGDSDALVNAVLDELRSPTGPDDSAATTTTTSTTSTTIGSTLPPTG